MRRPQPLAWLGWMIVFAPMLASAQSPEQPPPITITLRPAAEPRPALKYRVVPERNGLIPGNAAIFYHRALQMVADRRTRLDADRKVKEPPPARPESTDDRLYKWINGPIAEIPVAEARTLLQTFQTPLKEVEQGAIRTTCDWEFDRRPEGISLLLPEIQETRGLARLVALRARLAILDGQTDEAIHWIETGLVLGRHVGRGPIVIQALVGISIDFVMAKLLEELIQAPGTPSLYWALADRPRPFIDMREAYEGERYLLEKEIPGLLDLGQGPWGLDKARKFADELQRKLFSFDSGKTEGSTEQRLAIVGMTAKIYPEARKALIAQGRPEAEVDAMPVVQVACLYSYQEYCQIRDDMYKWLNVSYGQSVGRVDAQRLMDDRKRDQPLLMMFYSITPALNAARLAALRLDRQLDALQCVEAIRIYAASHQGKFPESLEAIVDAPPPLDPATGKPFLYKVDGDSATLSAPLPPGAPNHPSYMIRYALKLAR